MKTQIVLFLIISFSIELVYCQTPIVNKVYSTGNINSIDTLIWNLQDVTIPVIFETKNINIPENELRFSILNEKNITFFKDTIIGNSIYGRLKIKNELLPGIQVVKIESINENNLSLTKSFIIRAGRDPIIRQSTRQKINVNDFSNIQLLIDYSQNLKELKIYDRVNRKYISSDEFSLELKERNIENRKVLFETYCSNISYLQSNNYIFHIITNDIPSRTVSSPKKVRNLFSRGNSIQRFEEINVYKGQVSDLVIENKNNFNIEEGDDLILIGLNNQVINLMYSGKQLVAKGVKYENLSLSDCRIEKNGNDNEFFRIKINLFKEPKIYESILWKELNNEKLVNNEPYVDPENGKSFILEFFGEGITSDFIKKVKVFGAPNNISLTKFELLKGDNSFYSVLINIPKSTTKGNYIFKYELIDGSKKTIFNFNIAERNTPNIRKNNMSLILNDNDNKSIKYDFIGSEEKIESWNINQTWPELNINEDESLGLQDINIFVTIYNAKKDVIATFTQDNIEIKKTYRKVFKSADFNWVDSKYNYKQLKDWFSFQIIITYNKNNYYNFPSNESIEICNKEFVYQGKRVLKETKVSIPFAQTVFILGDSLQAAPYNFGINRFYKYRDKENRLDIEKLYWGWGLYFTQSELLKEQAMQFGNIIFVGWSFSENFNITVGSGLNWNIKFTKNANEYPSIRIPIVLNIGYDF